MRLLTAVSRWILRVSRVVLKWAAVHPVASVTAGLVLLGLGVVFTGEGASRTMRTVGQLCYGVGGLFLVAAATGTIGTWIRMGVETAATAVIRAAPYIRFWDRWRHVIPLL